MGETGGVCLRGVQAGGVTAGVSLPLLEAIGSKAGVESQDGCQGYLHSCPPWHGTKTLV